MLDDLCYGTKNLSESMRMKNLRITKYTIIRFFVMVLGIALLALGIALLRISDAGTDPYSCMNIGLGENVFHIGYGTMQMIVNILMYIPVLILAPKAFGIGALVNMFCVGYGVDAFTALFRGMGLTMESIADRMEMRILIFFLAILVYCVGVALYIECELGTSAYDMIGVIAEEKSKGKLKFQWVRIFTDFCCIGIGLLTGGAFGIGTFLVGFGTGPIVSFFRNLSKKSLPVIYMDREMKEEVLAEAE
ncbi:MAG: DUF6198 family protein [Lachnospiraceae bacterium]|nr:DUF6198 family protein [Lachnospiraceae bacterium]